MEEDYLLDISFVYALISFLAVVVLSKVYLTTDKVRRSWKDLLKEDAP
jgi:multisubunit Na+/H+ antiporter MnhF subunit